MKLTIIAAAGATILSLPATASAHHGQAVCAEQIPEIRFEFGGFTDDGTFKTWHLPVTATVTDADGPRTFILGRAEVESGFAVPVVPGHVTATAIWPGIDKGGEFRGFADVCGTPSPPVPVPPQPPFAPPANTPPTSSTRVVVPPTTQPVKRTCADLRRAGAGRKWLVKFNCAKPRPKRITCAYLNRVKAGPKHYTKRGWYFRCKPPKARVLPPSLIPVTG